MDGGQLGILLLFLHFTGEMMPAIWFGVLTLNPIRTDTTRVTRGP